MNNQHKGNQMNHKAPHGFSGIATAGSSDSLTRPNLEGIFKQLLDLNGRIADVNSRTEKELSRLNGSWPVPADDSMCGPETDGIIPAIDNVLTIMRRRVGDLEANTNRLSEL